MSITGVRALLPAITIGLVSGIGGIVVSLAMAALLFAGPLSPGLGYGVGAMFIGGAILALVIALRSTLPNSIASAQESSVAILAAAIIGATEFTDGPIEVQIATALGVLGVSTMTTGALFWITGRLRLGGLVRFMPYPVVAGFIAGSGWLLVDGSSVMLLGQHLGLDTLELVNGSNLVFLVLPAIVFAVVLKLAVEHFRSSLTVAVVLLVAALLYFAALWAVGLTIEEARALGYFPAVTEEGVELPSLDTLSLVDWGAVLSVALTIFAVAAISMVGMLLNVGGLELALRRDIDVNAELRSTGLANFLSGMVGGPNGFAALAFTILADRTGVHGRAAGVATAIVMLLGLGAASYFVYEVPVFLAAGFILFIGLDMLMEWLVATRRKLPLAEWLIVVFILACVIFIGFLEGIAVGLVVSVILFVFSYARLPIIRAEGNGIDFRSTVARSTSAARFLDSQGDAIGVIQLQGYLFFGSADGMVKHLQERLAEPGRKPLRFLVLDFRHVSGLDSAATTSFDKMRRVTEEHGVRLFLTQVPDDARRILELAGLRFGDDGAIVLESDIDHALEHAEEALLADHIDDEQVGALDYFDALAGPHPRMADLLARMTKIEADVGEKIISAGDQSDDLFFIEQGRVRVQVILPGGRTLRLRTMSAGAFVGEIGLYMRRKRTANVVVDAPSEIYRLRAEELATLETEDPELALLVHRLLAANLSEKLTVANLAIERREM